MANIAVIGGAGFIGSNLIKQLAKNPNNTISSIDCYLTGSKNNHVDSKNVQYLHGYAKDIASLLYFGPKYDYVFHFGEYSRVEQSFADIDTVFKLNQQMLPVLQFCRFNDAKLIYSGSSTKFSDEGKDLSPYAWTKASNTELVKSYAKWYGIDYAIVYFYNVYGPGEIESGEYATLIAKFNRMMQFGYPLTVVSPGTQTRNFTHVDDVVAALMLVSEHGQGDGYGIGSHEAYDVLTIAETFGGPIEMLPERAGNRMGAPVLTEKTEVLGWKPTYNVLEYIQKELNSGRIYFDVR